MIDLHTHVVPPRTPFLERLAGSDPRWARLEPAGETGDVIVAGSNFRTVRRVAWDLVERRERLAADGVTGHLLSAMPELFAPWAPAGDALDYARAFNGWLAAEVTGHDGFFTGLGVVPVQDPVAAAALLGEIAGQGLLGVEIPSAPPGAPLHDPVWADFLGEAERLGLLLFVHAVGGALAATFPHPGAANGVVFPSSIGQAVGGLIAAGTLERFPRLRLLASHGGGSLLTSLPRLDFMRATTPALQELMPQPPAVYAQRLWFDPLLFDATLLMALVDVVGADRVVLGTDYPFMGADPVTHLDDPAVPAALAAAIRVTNPQRLLTSLTAPT
ncbi:amidohydrolase family protein [Pseudonocardia sp. GCM10023141]|uniref:amidohydrolase family protein n=1 Tax=Pseudonocardia sp. GCM10023141 TaxID=3252653 RepID=UPI00361CE274